MRQAEKMCGDIDVDDVEYDMVAEDEQDFI